MEGNEEERDDNKQDVNKRHRDDASSRPHTQGADGLCITQPAGTERKTFQCQERRSSKEKSPNHLHDGEHYSQSEPVFPGLATRQSFKMEIFIILMDFLIFSDVCRLPQWLSDSMKGIKKMNNIQPDDAQR